MFDDNFINMKEIKLDKILVYNIIKNLIKKIAIYFNLKYNELYKNTLTPIC